MLQNNKTSKNVDEMSNNEAEQSKNNEEQNNKLSDIINKVKTNQNMLSRTIKFMHMNQNMNTNNMSSSQSRMIGSETQSNKKGIVNDIGSQLIYSYENKEQNMDSYQMIFDFNRQQNMSGFDDGLQKMESDVEMQRNNRLDGQINVNEIYQNKFSLMNMLQKYRLFSQENNISQ